MATAHLSPRARVISGGVTAADAQCFDGFCSQARVDIAAVPGSFPAAQMTVAGATRFIGIETDGKIKVYAGPASATQTEKESLAIVISGYEAVAVEPGHVVHVWLA